MARYIVLMSNMRDGGSGGTPSEDEMARTRKKIGKGLARAGGKLEALYATLGRYDFVAEVTIDKRKTAKDAELRSAGEADFAAGMALWLGRTAGVNTETLTALDETDTTNALRVAARCGGLAPGS